MASAKNQADAAAATDESPAVVEPTDFPLSLDEFCKRLSATDRRVELIGAFHHVELKDGRTRDTDGNYRARFLAFVNQPA